MPRTDRSPAALSRALIALLAIAALLPGVFEHHDTSHSLAHGAHATEPMEVSAVAHPGQTLHIEATETIHVAACPVCLLAQNPSLVLDLAPLPGRGGLRKLPAMSEPSSASLREPARRSARAPPQA